MSVIVPIGGKGLFGHLGLVVESLRPHMAGRDEIVVVEQRAGGRGVPEIEGVRYVPLALDGPFNLAACRNIGCRGAYNSILVMCDADCVKGPEFLTLARTRVHCGVAVHGLVRRLGQIPSEARLKAGRLGSFSDAWPLGLQEGAGFGDAVAFHRSDFRRAGGYHEGFKGWGAEDDDFRDRLARVAKIALGPDMRSLHVWHPQPKGKTEDAARNCALLNRRRAQRQGAPA